MARTNTEGPRIVKRTASYSVYLGDTYIGWVMNIGTKWAIYRADGVYAGTAKTRRAAAMALNIA